MLIDMQQKYNLLKSYEWFGTFWFQKENNETITEQEKFSGKLYYNPMEGIKLELLSYENNLSQYEKDQSKPPHILGVVNDGKEITKVSLFGCLFNVPERRVLPESFSKIKISAQYLLIGYHCFNRDFIFDSCYVKYKYIDEFVNFKNNNSIDSLLNFKLDNEININFFPSLAIQYQIKFASRQLKDETSKDYKIRQQKIQKLEEKIFKELKKLNAYIKKDIEDEYSIKIDKNDDNTENINKLMDSVFKITTLFTLLLCKRIYPEEIKLVYNIRNIKNNNEPYKSNVFVFKQMYIPKSEKIGNLLENNGGDPFKRSPFNLQAINKNQIEKFANLINDEDNSMLITYILVFIEKPIVYDYYVKEKFILAMALLEKEFNNLNSNNQKEINKYDTIITKYAGKEIINIFLYILENANIDNKDCNLIDILKTSDSYYLGAILAFFRNNIVHNQKQVGIKPLDTDIKKSLIKEYEKYWLESFSILPLINEAVSILLIKILYSKLGIEDEIFNEIIDRLLTKHYSSKEYRKKNIQELIKLNE